MPEAQEAITPARYRTDIFEIEVARRAHQLLCDFETITTMAGYDDPLRDAVLIAQEAISRALKASPIVKVGQLTFQQRTLRWLRPEALRQAEAATPAVRAKLDELVACTSDRPAGSTSERKDLVSYVVGAGRRLLHRLGDPRCAHEVTRALAGMTTVAREALGDPKCGDDVIKALVEMTTVTREAHYLPYVTTVAACGVQLPYRIRYRKGLDFALLVAAVIASAQEALRDGPGNVRKGAPNHLRTLSALVVSAGIEKPTTEALRNDYREARNACRDPKK